MSVQTKFTLFKVTTHCVVLSMHSVALHSITVAYFAALPIKQPQQHMLAVVVMVLHACQLL